MFNSRAEEENRQLLEMAEASFLPKIPSPKKSQITTVANLLRNLSRLSRSAFTKCVESWVQIPVEEYIILEISSR